MQAHLLLPHLLSSHLLLPHLLHWLAGWTKPDRGDCCSRMHRLLQLLQMLLRMLLQVLLQMRLRMLLRTHHVEYGLLRKGMLVCRHWHLIPASLQPNAGRLDSDRASNALHKSDNNSLLFLPKCGK